MAPRAKPSIRVVAPYFADSRYIDALATVARESLASLEWAPDVCLLSFHGLPARYAKQGDPYPDHCAATAGRLRDALGRPAAQG